MSSILDYRHYLLAMIAGFIFAFKKYFRQKNWSRWKNHKYFDEKKFAEFKRELKRDPIIKDTLEEGEKEQFLKGAEIAYESILTSFAKGEKKELKKLLTKDMFMNFDQAIDNRNKENIKSELTFIGVKESKVEKFEKIKINLVATVKIVCEIISVKKDKEGNVIEGNPDIIKTVTDYWNFTKDASSDNPNWFLAEIISK